MQGNLETAQKETQNKPRQAGILSSHWQSSVCKLVTRGLNHPTDRFGLQWFKKKKKSVGNIEIIEVSSKTRDL